MRNVLTLLIGMIFGTGIAISGMINPAKVLNFFDVAGAWDPSLAFVMGGAVVVAFLGYRIVLRRAQPVYELAFKIPSNMAIDARLLFGAGVFGIGWGIAGFCPGGALPALGTANVNVIVFVATLVAGMFVTRIVTAMMPQASGRSI
jgi:uncharacterized membrane protein YedE/YeeE